jgi:hypothetical protein
VLIKAVFVITSIFASYFHDFQINSAVAQTGPGYGIELIGTGTGTIAKPVIERVAFSNVYAPIWMVRPSWPSITDCYFTAWGAQAIGLVTSATIEGSGGFISHNYFFGSTAFGAQTSAIYSEVGYTDIHDNEILGANQSIYFNITNYPAGFIKIHDNTIEDSLAFGILIDTANTVQAPATMVMIQDNEFSNVAYLTNLVSEIYIAEVDINGVGQDWIQDITISGNTLRSKMINSNQKYIWIGAGRNISVAGNTIEELGNAFPTAIQLTGVISNAGLADPILVLDNVISGSIATVPYNLASTVHTILRDLRGLALGSLPYYPGAGSQVFITNGTSGSPCTGSGPGAMGFYQNGAWKCF